jgi:hypothetical protein
MAEREWNITDVATMTGMDPGTIGDFLNGKRWPKIGNQGKFEKALGWAPGTLGRLARGELILPSEMPPTDPQVLVDESATPDIGSMSQDEFDAFYEKVTREAQRRMREGPASRLDQVEREQENPA